MPIKFRCAYCNQLMGIARRKAGTVVRCPACSGQVIVPNPSDEPTEKPPESPAGEAELFERSDFEELFGSAAGGKRSSPNPPAASPRGKEEVWPLSPLREGNGGERAPAPAGSAAAVTADKPEPYAFDVERVNVAPKMVVEAGETEFRPGIFLSPRRATLLIVAVILALALAFAAGLIVGLLLHSAPRESQGEQAKTPIQSVESRSPLPQV